MKNVATCPMCHKEIGKNDFLSVAKDATGNGTFWVRHFVSSDVPIREHESPEYMHGVIDGTPLDISYNHIRGYCGSAGFSADQVRHLFA